MPDRSDQALTSQISAVPSPCIRNCCLDEDDICLGCFRSLDEIVTWGSIDDGMKHHILTLATRRRQDRANDH